MEGVLSEPGAAAHPRGDAGDGAGRETTRSRNDAGDVAEWLKAAVC